MNKFIKTLLLTIIFCFNNFSAEKKFDIPQLLVLEGVTFIGSIDAVLNSPNYYETILTLYFKLNPTTKFHIRDLDYGEISKKRFEEMFKKENLELHYNDGVGIKLKNGDTFLYGRITRAGGTYESNGTEPTMYPINLELFFIDKNNEFKVKRYVKNTNRDIKLYELIDKVDSSKQEGFYGTKAYREEVTIMTRNKKIYQIVNYLTEDRRELYEEALRIFKDEIPKEFFEGRKYNKNIDIEIERFDWKNCENCIKE